MKILIIGASGTIGSAITRELAKDTEVIQSSLNNPGFPVDLASAESIKQLFKKTGKLDGVICAAARGVVFKPVTKMLIADYQDSLQQKLFGQITVALESLNVLNDGGSITLTTGIMNHDFVKNGSAAAMTNNAVEGFAQSAALAMPRNIRINVVSPSLLQDSVETYADICPGFEAVSSEKVARAFRKSVYGIQTGRVYHVK